MVHKGTLSPLIIIINHEVRCVKEWWGLAKNVPQCHMIIWCTLQLSAVNTMISERYCKMCVSETQLLTLSL